MDGVKGKPMMHCNNVLQEKRVRLGGTSQHVGQVRVLENHEPNTTLLDLLVRDVLCRFKMIFLRGRRLLNLDHFFKKADSHKTKSSIILIKISQSKNIDHFNRNALFIDE
jgi:hypothetical protein